MLCVPPRSTLQEAYAIRCYDCPACTKPAGYHDAMAVHAANRALTQCFGLLYSLVDLSQLGSTGKLTRPFLLSCQLLSISVYLSQT